MDESVRKAMAKWPDVPALYDWLRLDATGRWYVKGELITHRGLIDYIGRNYECDNAGRWFFQNGPQRGYVSLDYTPWVLHVDSSGTLCNHVGTPVTPGGSATVDDEGNLLIETGNGVGLVDSDSLPTVIEGLVDGGGNPLNEDDLAGLIAGDASADPYLNIVGQRLPLGCLPRVQVPAHFGFIARPQADDSANNGSATPS